MIFAIPWIIIMFLFRYLFEEPISLEIGGIVIGSGLLAGVIFAFIMKALAKRFSTQIPVDVPEGETLIKEDGANHFKGAEAVGGKLILTNQRLIFRSHSFNIQNHEENILLSRIKEVSSFKTLGMVPNGLKVLLDTSEEHRFVIDNRSVWIDSILKYRNNLS
jgi:hypothetical protein